MISSIFGSLFKDQSLVLKKAEKPVTILKKKKDHFYRKGHPEKEFKVTKLTFNPPLPYSGQVYRKVQLLVLELMLPWEEINSRVLLLVIG